MTIDRACYRLTSTLRIAVLPPFVAASALCSAPSSSASFSTRWPWKPKWLPELLVVRPVDGDAEMQIFAGRGAIGIVMDMALSHRFVFLVVEDDDDDRQVVALGGAERLDDRVVKERAVADEQRHRPLGRRELDAERGADPLAEAA